MMTLCIDYETYVAVMAALLEQDAMNHLEERWTKARKTMKAAMLASVTREIDQTTSILLRRQAG